MHCSEFESAIVKILNQQTTLLTDKECQLAEPFTVEDNDLNSNSEFKSCSELSFVERARKKRKVLYERAKYMDLRFIALMSNICERLFSVAGYALSDRRQGINPSNFEKQLFLHANSHLWGLDELKVIMNE